MTNLCRRCESITGVHCEEPDGYGESFLSNLGRYLVGTEQGKVYIKDELARTTNETIAECPVILHDATPKELYESLMRQINRVAPDVVTTDPI